MNRPQPGTLGLADIVATTFNLFVKNVRVFLLLGVLGAVLTVLDSALGQALIDAFGLKVDTSNGAAHLSGNSGAGIFALVAIQIMSTALIYFLGDALIVPAAFEAVLGKRPSASSALLSFRYSLPVILLIWLLIGVGVTAMLISVVLIPLAIFFLVRWSFVVQIVNREGHSALAAMRRSSTIVRGYWWRVFIVQIAVAVLAALPALALRPLGNVIDSAIADYVLVFIAAILAGPFAAIARTVLYADIKLRRNEQLSPPSAVAS